MSKSTNHSATAADRLFDCDGFQSDCAVIVDRDHGILSDVVARETEFCAARMNVGLLRPPYGRSKIAPSLPQHCPGSREQDSSRGANHRRSLFAERIKVHFAEFDENDRVLKFTD